MNSKNKYNHAFIKPINKKQLDQLAGNFNLSEEELLMIEKISKNPLEIINNKNSIEMMKKTADKVFKGMSKEEKVAFENFKKFNEKEIIGNKEKTVSNDNSTKNSDDLNVKEVDSKKEKNKNWWKFW